VVGVCAMAGRANGAARAAAAESLRNSRRSMIVFLPVSFH
jgi:hypothetical protein